MEPKDKAHIGIDWGTGNSVGYTFYGAKPQGPRGSYTTRVSYIGDQYKPTSVRKLWGIELLIDLRAATPGPEQKKYQKAQFELRKARANEAG